MVDEQLQAADHAAGLAEALRFYEPDAASLERAATSARTLADKLEQLHAEAVKRG